MKRPQLVAIVLLAASFAFGKDAKETRRPSITGIQFVRVYAKDPAKSRTFYTKELMLPETKCPEKDCSRYQVGKQQYVDVIKATNDQDGIQVFGFRTTDAKALLKYLAEHDQKVPNEVQKTKDGLQFELVDPEGHRFVFIQPSKDSDQQGAISHRMIHVGFIVHNRADEDPLFRDLLGFRPYWHGGMQDDRTDWVSLQVPDGTDWLEYMLNIPANASHRLIGVENHFSLGVVEMEGTEAAIMKTGWKPNKDEHKQLGKDGKMQLNVFDPDDVRVEFMNFKPSEKPCCSEFTASHPQP